MGRGRKVHFFQCTSFKVQREKNPQTAAFHQEQLHISHNCFKRKPINNDDCLMLQFYSNDKTKIAANSQGNTSTELFHGSCNAYKVLPVGYKDNSQLKKNKNKKVTEN